jgi:spoIIIJ-associated protein
VDERKDQPQDGALLLDDGDEGIPQGRKGRAGDGKAEEARNVLEDILEYMDLDAEVDVREDDEKVILDVSGPDAGRAIGKKGQTLDALQFLVNKIVNRFPDGRRHIVVDSGDYRTRHDEGLEAMARREAKRAVQEGKVITLKPMSARDRRVIHLSLAKFEGVSTASQGEGMQRRIQIIPSRSGGGGGGGNGNARRRRRR